MFDGVLPGPAELAAASDAELIDALTGWARTAAAAEARKLAAAAELLTRRQTEETNPHRACDAVDGAAAEIAAALTLRHGRALTLLDLATTLHDRLPKVGAAFLAGDLSTTMITTIHFRTELVEDHHALTQLDTALAERAAAWGPLSQYKLEQAIDLWVERYDPDAVRRTRDNIRSRYLSIGKRDDPTATTTVHGRLTGPDAALLNTRIATMIHTVCPDDPRTLAQRRADALGAIAAGATTLPCRCENPDCPATTTDTRAHHFVINVITDATTLNTPTDPTLHGTDHPDTDPTDPIEGPQPAPTPPDNTTPTTPADTDADADAEAATTATAETTAEAATTAETGAEVGAEAATTATADTTAEVGAEVGAGAATTVAAGTDATTATAETTATTPQDALPTDDATTATAETTATTPQDALPTDDATTATTPEPATQTATATPNATTRPTTETTGPERHTDTTPGSPEPPPAPPPQPSPALIPGTTGTIVPPTLLAELITAGAPIRPITTGTDLPPCTTYRPTTALDRFIRTRDLTCRAPGCDRPATTADIDHTNPWPTGATHPANNKCYCRLHHLIKTFHPDWTDTQHPDGTLTVTTPTGHTYTTKPFTALLFPHWNTTTDPPPRKPTPPPPPAPDRTLMMPTRRHTRAQAKAARITRERRDNATQRALQHAAAQQAAQQHRAETQTRRAATHTAPTQQQQWAARMNLADHLRQPPPHHGDDPPPF